MNIKDNWYLNNRFGKKVLFIEAPHVTKFKVFPFIKQNKVTKCICLSPLYYEDSKYPSITNYEDFEHSATEVYTKLKEMGMKIIPHIHIQEDTSEEEVRIKITETLAWFKGIGIESNEICFGWWYNPKVFIKVSDELNLKRMNRQFHYYDFWI